MAVHVDDRRDGLGTIHRRHQRRVWQKSDSIPHLRVAVFRTRSVRGVSLPRGGPNRRASRTYFGGRSQGFGSGVWADVGRAGSGVGLQIARGIPPKQCGHHDVPGFGNQHRWDGTTRGKQDVSLRHRRPAQVGTRRPRRPRPHSVQPDDVRQPVDGEFAKWQLGSSAGVDVGGRRPLRCARPRCRERKPHPRRLPNRGVPAFGPKCGVGSGSAWTGGLGLCGRNLRHAHDGQRPVHDQDHPKCGEWVPPGHRVLPGRFGCGSAGLSLAARPARVRSVPASAGKPQGQANG